MFKTCFVARIAEAAPSPKAFVCCRFDPDAQWRSPPTENLLAFCFPLGVDAVKRREYMRPEEFSFTLTAGNGSRLHGFCRRTLPPRKAPAKPAAPTAAKTAMLRYPQVLCIVSQHPWFPFFYKVLELVEKMLRQEDLGADGSQGWPVGSPAAALLAELLVQMPAAAPPPLGQVLRVRLPQTELPLDFSPPRRALTGPARSPLLHADRTSVELEVPPDLGLGPENAGIAAARLLFHLPPRVALTLVAALLLERRIILVASAEDKVSAAVHAAAALLYPFRWQHIYLPLLPMSLKDYLAAPMPYLVGLNSDCLPMLRTMAMEEVLIVDLDLGECTPPPDTPRDDAFLLPFAPKLLSALETCKDGTLSSTEFNSTPFIASVMQEYFLKLGLGKYRLFMQPDGGGPSPRAGSANRGGGRADDIIRAHGYAFDQAAFVAQHKNAAVRDFLQHFRHSQMFEVFITDRLRMAARGEVPQDSFEAKVTQFMSKQPVFGGSQAAPAAGAPGQSSGRFSAMLKKTASAMRQSSDSLMKGLKTLGTNQDEAYVSMSRRTSNSFSLQRVSPNLHTGSPMAAGGKGLHSRTPSQGQLGGRTGSFTNLSRGSPIPLGGLKPVPVSLEDVKPDVFFGDVEDDAASEASEGSVYARSGNSSPGPSEPGASRSRTFTSLFRLSTSQASQSAAASPRHPAPQPLRRDDSGKSSSSPSLISLDVQARSQQQAQQSQPPPPQQQHRAAVASPGSSFLDLLDAAPPSSLPEWPAAPVRPHAIGPRGGSGAFGSPVGSQVSRRPSPNLHDPASFSPLGHEPHLSHLAPRHGNNAAPAAAAPGALGQAQRPDPAAAILSALSSSAVPPLPARQSTGSSSSEWTAFATATTGSDRPQKGEPLAALRRSGGSLGSGGFVGQAGGLASMPAVKSDAFGGLLADTFSSVASELEGRRRTSSQERAATGRREAVAASTAMGSARTAGAAGGAGSPGAVVATVAASAAVSPAAAPLEESSESWADFSGAGFTSEPPSGGSAAAAGAGQQQPLQPSLASTMSWGDWSAVQPGLPGPAPVDALATELARKCTSAGGLAPAARQQSIAAVAGPAAQVPTDWGAFAD